MPKAISFDLQGTLSNSAFSDEFWLTLLPELYAEHHSIDLTQAKGALKEKFAQMGKYDYRYYCARYWLKLLCPGPRYLELPDLLPRFKNQPQLYPDTLELVAELKQQFPVIIVSTTTHDFIQLELAEAAQQFNHVFSSLDDFGIAGKTKLVYEKAARHLNVTPNEVLHIGDCKEMDIQNAQAAGCSTFFFDKSKNRAQCLDELGETLQIKSKSSLSKRM